MMTSNDSKTTEIHGPFFPKGSDGFMSDEHMKHLMSNSSERISRRANLIMGLRKHQNIIANKTEE